MVTAKRKRSKFTVAVDHKKRLRVQGNKTAVAAVPIFIIPFINSCAKRIEYGLKTEDIPNISKKSKICLTLNGNRERAPIDESFDHRFQVERATCYVVCVWREDSAKNKKQNKTSVKPAQTNSLIANVYVSQSWMCQVVALRRSHRR